MIKFLLFLFIFLLPLGQVFRIEFLQGIAVLTPQDLIVAAIFLVWLVDNFGIKKSYNIPPFFLTILLFFLILLISLVFGFRMFLSKEILVGSLFLIRLFLYVSLYFIVFSALRKDNLDFWTNLLFLSGLIFVFLGFLQLFLIPDISFLTPFGWDPHVGRMVSTFLDPNFAGFFFLITLVLGSIFFLEKRNIFYLGGSIVSLLAIILTFSRSSYLALAAAIILIGLLRSKWLFLSFSVIFMLLSFFVPRVPERISGLVTGDITVQARIQSWQLALTIFKDNPLLGVGFNNYRFAQRDYGFFSSNQPLGGHSGAGADSSFLTILATAGVLGGIFMFVFMFNILFKTFSFRKKGILSLTFVIIALSLFIHTQFVNSLIFPSITALFFILLAFSQVEVQGIDKSESFD